MYRSTGGSPRILGSLQNNTYRRRNRPHVNEFRFNEGAQCRCLTFFLTRCQGYDADSNPDAISDAFS